MAMPFILNHNENIYSLEEERIIKTTKGRRCVFWCVFLWFNSSWYSFKNSPRFQSKHLPLVVEEIKNAKSHHKTMGYAEVPLESPRNFLKVGAGVRPQSRSKDHVCPRRFVAPVPRGLPLRSQSANLAGKQFELNNIRSAMNSKPRRPSARYVDTRNGDFHELQKSGLRPFYVYKPNFGKLPKYLVHRTKELASLDGKKRSEEIKKQPKYRYITQDERNEILRVSFGLCL